MHRRGIFSNRDVYKWTRRRLQTRFMSRSLYANVRNIEMNIFDGFCGTRIGPLNANNSNRLVNGVFPRFSGGVIGEPAFATGSSMAGRRRRLFTVSYPSSSKSDLCVASSRKGEVFRKFSSFVTTSLRLMNYFYTIFV